MNVMSDDDDRLYHEYKPRERVMLLSGFALLGLVVGVLLFPAEWSVGLRAICGVATGISAVLMVYINRMLGP